MQVVIAHLTGALVLAAVAGCGAATTTTATTAMPAGGNTGDQAPPGSSPWRGVDRLPDARADFAAQPDDYRFKLRSTCGGKQGRGNRTVTVRDGRVADVATHPAHGSPGSAEAPTVEGVFAEIEAAASTGAEVDVAFSPHGYPRKVTIDNDAGVPGDDVCYHLHGLHFLAHGGR